MKILLYNNKCFNKDSLLLLTLNRFREGFSCMLHQIGRMSGLVGEENSLKLAAAEHHNNFMSRLYLYVITIRKIKYISIRLYLINEIIYKNSFYDLKY